VVNALLATSDKSFHGTRVLITGGLGFIGANLALNLSAQGAHVTLLDNLLPGAGGNEHNIHSFGDRVNAIQGDLRDPQVLEQCLPDQQYIFNLAGHTSHQDSMRMPDLDLEMNVRAQLSLLEACRQHSPGARIVFAGTRQIYGKPRYLPVDETHPVAPVDINGIHKFAGEMYHHLYRQVHGFETTVLRLTNTYGPRMRVKDDRQTFLGTWIKRLLNGEPLKIFGDGEQLRDFNYVDDVVEALLLCALSPDAVGKTYNLGSREVVSLSTLAELLTDLHGSGTYERVAFPAPRKRIDIGDYHGDFSRIETDLGWSPSTDLATGLARTLNFFDENRGYYWP
jgi:nucleoside-diphosphate-sugar epimerase